MWPIVSNIDKELTSFQPCQIEMVSYLMSLFDLKYLCSNWSKQVFQVFKVNKRKIDSYRKKMLNITFFSTVYNWTYKSWDSASCCGNCWYDTTCYPFYLQSLHRLYAVHCSSEILQNLYDVSVKRWRFT